MRWVLTNIISWTVGMTVGFSVWRIFGGVISGDSTGYVGMDFSQGEVLGIFILSVVVALGQYLVLRQKLPPRSKWIIGTLVGSSMGALLARLFGQPILQYSDCGLFCFGFDLLPLWVRIH